MSFSFGAPQAQPSTSLFGASTNKPAAPSTTFGGFSTPNPQQQQSQPTISLFGSNTQPQQQQQGSGMFGQAGNTNQPAGGGLFGSTNNAQQPAQGGLFGTTTNNTQPSQPTSGLFGSTNTAQPASGLFGGTQQQQNTQQSGGLFGSTQTQQNSNTGGAGLFGQPQQQQQQGQLGLSIIGGMNQSQNTNTNQNSGGLGLGSSLFGNTSMATNQPGTSNLFGQTQQPQQQQPQQGSLFGQQPQSYLFGSTNQNQNQNQSQGLFGSTNVQASQQGQPQTNSLFSSTNNGGIMGSSNLAASSLGGGTLVKKEIDIGTRMLSVKNAWDPNSSECRFKHFFYNVVDAGTVGQYGRPAGATDETKWKQAVRDNPEPSTMVPVLATGWEDVKKRSQMQEAIASVHQQRVKEITLALDELTRKTTLSSSIRLQNLQSQLQSLQHRLIHLAAHSPAYIPSLQGTSVQPAEMEIKTQLEAVKAGLEGRSGGGGRKNGKGEGRMIGQVNEMWGMVEELRRRRKVREGGREGWLGDEKALAEVAQILATQQQALQKLTGLTNDVGFDVEVMRQDLGLVTHRRD